MDEGWGEFPRKYGICNIFRFGDEYPLILSKTMNNKFWKDFLMSLHNLNNHLKYSNTLQLHNMPLWHNSRIKLNYRKEWDKKGYLMVKDLMHINGNLFTQKEMKEKGLKVHFLDYLSLSRQIKKLEQTCGKNSVEIGPCLPRILFEIGLTQKGCNRTYNKLQNYNHFIINEVKQKWETTLNKDIGYNIIENSFNAITTFKEGAYCKHFQFKLLHSRTAINDKLFRMNLIDSNICKMCQTEVETIMHTFIDCVHVTDLWKQIEKWLRNILNEKVKLDDIDIIFVKNKGKEIVNKTILFTKIAIFNNRKTGRNHSLKEVKRLLYKQMCTEEYQAEINHTEYIFWAIWGEVFVDLTVLFLT